MSNTEGVRCGRRRCLLFAALAGAALGVCVALLARRLAEPAGEVWPLEPEAGVPGIAAPWVAAGLGAVAGVLVALGCTLRCALRGVAGLLAITLLLAAALFARQGLGWLQADGRIWVIERFQWSPREVGQQLHALLVEGTGAEGRPTDWLLRFEDTGGRRLAGLLDPTPLEAALATVPSSLTLGLHPDHSAQAELDQALEVTRQRVEDIEAYLALLRMGRPAAAAVQAAARQASEQYRPEDSLRGPLLALVARALLGLDTLCPDADDEAELVRALGARMGVDEALEKAVVRVRRESDPAGIRELIDLLSDSSYRIRHLAARYLLGLIAPDHLPQEATPLIPLADDQGGWNRLVGSWREWWSRSHSRLQPQGTRWVVAPATRREER